MNTVLASSRQANQNQISQDTPITKKGTVYLEAESTTPLGPRIISADKEAERITGYSAETLIGQPIGLIYDPGSLDSFVALLHRRVREMDYCWADKLLVRKGGKCVMHRWTFSPLRSGQGIVHGFAVTMEPLGATQEIRTLDVSEKEEPENVRYNADAAYDDSRSESLAIVAAGIAHDFKNVLQTMRSTLEMANLTVQKGTKTHEYISDAELALGDAVALATQMLAFTKGQESEMQATRLDEMLGKVAKISTMGTDVKHQVTVASDLQQIHADRRQIYQVFQNIIINGCQAMPEGGIIQLNANNVEIPNGEPGLAAGSYVVVEIRDRGCGISAENLKKIFSPDFTTKKDGTGIGLASCEAIVKNHGGKIVVDSTPYIGTEFIIFLPVSEEPTRQIEARTSVSSGLNRVESITQPSLEQGCFSSNNDQTSPPQISRSRLGGGRVLIVDDQERVLTTAEKLLQFLGYETVCATTGEAALSVYCEHFNSNDPIDAVLLDMTLPGGLSGHEVKTEIKKFDANARIIATSGYFEDEHATASFLEEGWSGVLPKPYAIEALKKTVTEAILRS